MKALVFSTASDRLPRRLHTIPLSRGPRARQTLQAYSDTHYQQRKNTSRPSIRDDPRGSGCPSPPVQHRPAGGNRFFLEMRDYPQILLPEVLSSIGDSFLAGGSARLVFFTADWKSASCAKPGGNLNRLPSSISDAPTVTNSFLVYKINNVMTKPPRRHLGGMQKSGFSDH